MFPWFVSLIQPHRNPAKRRIPQTILAGACDTFCFVRVLFSCRPAFGHYAPLVPLADALVNAGHTVTFATGAPLDTIIHREGFEVDQAGLSGAESQAVRQGDARFAPADSDPRLLRPLNFALKFAGYEVPPRLADLVRVIERRRPDLVVHETSEFAGPLAAALKDLPSVNHSFGPLVEPEVMAAAASSAAEHWIAHGLTPPDRAGMYGRLYIDITPPSLQFSEIATVPNVQPLRPEPFRAHRPEPAPWLSLLGDRPLAVVTLGTVHNDRFDIYRAALDGLAHEDVDVVVATGSASVTARLGQPPVNAQVHDWVPWSELLARAAVVVTHGGAGSTLGPLCKGVPVVVIPLGADHFTNARMLGPSGAAVILDVNRLTPELLGEAVATAMSEPVRSAARQIAEEVKRMPSAEQVVNVLPR
jgi:UDP:flavonoid glycosyltransferase YjiC (YdhE family)